MTINQETLLEIVDKIDYLRTCYRVDLRTVSAARREIVSYARFLKVESHFTEEIENLDIATDRISNTLDEFFHTINELVKSCVKIVPEMNPASVEDVYHVEEVSENVTGRNGESVSSGAEV